MMHEKARARHERQIRAARTPGERDAQLDQYADGLLRATEWDADQWGLDPDHWMEAERVELTSRGGRDWPQEAI